MDLQQLQYFSVTAHWLHFTKAAADLHITQPHLSREIRKLEHELGATLFERSTRQVQLTEAGIEFLDRTNTILGDIEQASEAARAVHTGLCGRLTVGFVGSITYSWLPTLVQYYRNHYPDVHLDIRSEMLTGMQIDALLNRAIDVGVLRLPVDNPDISTVLLHSEPLIAAVPETHRLAKRQRIPVRKLASEPFVTYAEWMGSSTRKAILETCLAAGFAPQTAQPVVDTHTLISLVAAGMGIALAPQSTQHFTVPGVVYRRLSGTISDVQLAIAWLTESQKPSLRTFIELATHLIPDTNPHSTT